MQISERIPHGPGLILIDRIIRYDESFLEGATMSHRRSSHPLARKDGKLPASAGIEYGGQAIALHLGLIQTESFPPPGIGLLIRVRDIRWSIHRLDAISDELVIQAFKIEHSNPLAVYNFNLSSAAGVSIMEGQLSVYLQTEHHQR